MEYATSVIEILALTRTSTWGTVQRVGSQNYEYYFSLQDIHRYTHAPWFS